MPNDLVRVKTNKDQYVSGESVHISGTVSPIVSTNTVDIQIYDPEKKPYRYEVVPVKQDSSYGLDLRLGSKFDISGTYEIAVSSGKESAHARFSYANDEFGDKVVVIPYGSHNVASGKSFQPTIITGLENNRVTWINQDSISHTATSGDPHTHKADGKFDTGFIPPGASKTITLTNPDEQLVSYFCQLHSWEKGVVNTNPHKKDVSIREELTLSESIDIKVIRGDEILEAHKQLAKLERHLSNDQIQTLKFDEISKTKDRVLTIVFWDICNFSQLSEYLKGNRNLLVEFLQEFYSRVTETIFKNGGSLDKFVGDGAMAIFGIVSRDDKVDAITAVLAALEMRQEFQQLLRKWLAIWRRHIPQKIDIDIRCGIHTGTVTYGNIGTLKNDQLTAVGADVNIASRLETKATPNKIVISTTTESRVRNEFQLKPMGSLDLKNIGGAFTIFEVIGHKQLDS